MASRRDAPAVLSSTSGRVRAARRLVRRTARERSGLFLAEGPQAVREALLDDDRVVEVFATAAGHPGLVEAAAERGVPWRLVDDAAISSLSDTVTPQGVVAVCRAVTRPLAEVMQPNGSTDATATRLVAACVDVRDPGNAGTIVRCADAAGADVVAMLGDSVDVHNAKAVRASAGSVFHLPVAVHRDLAEAVEMFRSAGLRVLAADGHADRDLEEATDAGLLAAPTAWLLGNEAHGLHPAALRLADEAVRIPIHGRAESLNLATAAAVCLYATARAHRVVDRHRRAAP